MQLMQACGLVVHDCDDNGMMVDFLKHVGTTDCDKDSLKMVVNTPDSGQLHSWCSSALLLHACCSL